MDTVLLDTESLYFDGRVGLTINEKFVVVSFFKGLFNGTVVIKTLNSIVVVSFGNRLFGSVNKGNTEEGIAVLSCFKVLGIYNTLFGSVSTITKLFVTVFPKLVTVIV